MSDSVYLAIWAVLGLIGALLGFGCYGDFQHLCLGLGIGLASPIAALALIWFAIVILP